jgi:hypothetical protein
LNPTQPGLRIEDLAIQLRNVEEKIITELRSVRNQALQSRVRTVFSTFRNLADNNAGDPTNASTWSMLQFEQQRVADEMFDIIMHANDVRSSYELATGYNTLLATGTAVLKTKGEIFPGFPSSWLDNYFWLQPGMEANYRMVKSQRHQCYPGFNPGFNQSTSSTVPGDWISGNLVRLLANKYVTISTFPCGSTQCNIANKFCFTNTVQCSGGGGTAWHACNWTLGDLGCAAKLAKPAYDADPVVTGIRASMVAIQRASGGNDFDGPNNDPLVAQGKLVDPWVSEPLCGSSAPWAYPQVP